MKIVKKISTIALSAVLLMAVSAGSASAKWGWGDDIYSANQLYYSGGGSSSASAPIEGTSDYDFYVLDNTTSGSDLSYSLALKSPSGLNYDLQLITVDSNGSIVKTRVVYDTGSGGTDATGATLDAGHKLYVKVYSHGSNDYSSSEFYSLKFTKNN